MSPKRRTNNTPQRAGVILRLLFAVYLFFYFFRSQDAAIALGQHRLSGGQTEWHPLIGAIVLTALLMLLEDFVGRCFRFKAPLRALTFFPSALFAVLITTPAAEHPVGTYIASGVLTLIWLIIYVVGLRRKSAKNAIPTHTVKSSLHFPHTLTFFLIAFYMGVCGTCTDLMNFEVNATRDIAAGNYADALKHGEKSLATSPRLTALRAFAGCQVPGGTSNIFSCFPLPEGGSELLLIQRNDTVESLFRPDSLYSYLRKGILPRQGQTLTYFERAAKLQPKGAGRDYWLCALLLDRNLERFAKELPQYYAPTDSTELPLHYAEAILLYSHLQSKECPYLTDSTIIERYANFKVTEAECLPKETRRNQLWRDFGKTYWWYYHYNQ